MNTRVPKDSTRLRAQRAVKRSERDLEVESVIRTLVVVVIVAAAFGAGLAVSVIFAPTNGVN